MTKKIAENKYVASYAELSTLNKGSLFSASRNLIRSGILSSLAAFDRVDNSNFLRLLYCHYVFDDQIDEFERMVITLKERGRFIGTDDCISMISGRRKIDGPFFNLSFDDGFQNIVENALPVLIKHEVPATLFVPTQFISCSYEFEQHYCLNIARYSGVIKMASWSELREAASAGFEIASHTRTHARFSDISLSEDRLLYELAGSKNDIEDMVKQECKYISWPYGTISDADALSLSAVREFGYLGCFGAYRGAVVPGQTDLFSIPRHHFEPEWPLAHVVYFAHGGMENSR